MIKAVISGERGGVSIMALSVVALFFSVLALSISVDFCLQSNTVARLKHHLMQALHAASLSVDEEQLGEGLLRLDVETPGVGAQDEFYSYLQRNAGLDGNNLAELGSDLPLHSLVIVHELLYADVDEGLLVNLLDGNGTTSCSLLGSTIHCSLTMHVGTPKETKRDITELLVGPSLIGIVEAEHDGLGLLDDEPIVVAGIQEVKFYLEP